MDHPTQKDLFEALGRAACVSQLFEFTFITAVRLALNQPNVSTLEEVIPLLITKSFKQPITALLRELVEGDAIDPTIVNRIVNWIECRHKVIHRQFPESGWPTEEETEKSRTFFEQCNAVVNEGDALIREFVPIVLQWMAKFPESASVVASLNELLKQPRIDAIVKPHA